jgi:hypothetical protein
MSEEALRHYAEAFEGIQIYKPAAVDLPDVVVKHGGTRIGVWFDKGKLRAVDIVWISQPMKVSAEPKRDLCVGSSPKTGVEINPESTENRE